MMLLFFALYYLIPIIFFIVIGCIVMNSLDKLPLNCALLALILLVVVFH